MSNHHRRIVVHRLLLALSFGSLSVAAAEDARSIPVGQRQLFLDDDAIAKIEHLQRTLHQPEKRGAVIRSVNPSQTIQTRTAPIWESAAKHYNIQLVTSRDLVHWQRVAERAPFLEASPLGAGAYDTQTIIGPSAPVVRGDELWFYYTGVRHRHYGFVASGYDDYYPDKGAVCPAVLRRDGFVSLDAGEEPGTLLTKPFVLAGKTLHVNVDAKAGELGVTVLDGDGQTVAEPVTGDQACAVLRWKSGDLANVKGKTVNLGLSLRKAQLYSFWSE